MWNSKKTFEFLLRKVYIKLMGILVERESTRVEKGTHCGALNAMRKLSIEIRLNELLVTVWWSERRNGMHVCIALI